MPVWTTPEGQQTPENVALTKEQTQREAYDG